MNLMDKLVLTVLVWAFFVFSIFMTVHITERGTYQRYCRSLGYDSVITANDTRYCINKDLPDNTYYIPW